MQKPTKNSANNIEILISNIQETNNYFVRQVQKQVNTALTLRNFIIGYILFEYELNGEDRAVYGERLFKEIAQRTVNIKGMSERNLYLFKSFYLAYPNILQSTTAKSYLVGFNGIKILQSAPAKSFLQKPKNTEILQTQSAKSDTAEVLNKLMDSKEKPAVVQFDLDALINHLSFTHIIELLKAEAGTKRNFYETETIKNNWTVRDLQRAMNSMLYERTGLSKNKKAVIEKHVKGDSLKPEDVFRNPYILEFLNIEEKPEYSETDIEQAIINHLQKFLIELGKGFCFEARQKRITFDNKHYRIDLVFYHRVLKCNVLIDLKIGEFDHSDAGQMNVYLNYYRENEMTEDDNPPIGIILCAYKNANLVKYATAGLPQKVFVNKYLVNLPKEDDLKKIIVEEQLKLEQ